jgi:putative hydrolase of the HAD superfamily
VIRAVLFDAAGTLVATREPVGETYARLAAAHGVRLPAWRLEDAFRRALRSAPAPVFPGAPPELVRARERDWWRQVVRRTFRAADASARFPDFDAFFAELYDAFARPELWRAAEGAAQALAALRARGLATGVVSNFDGRLPGILRGLGLAPLLDVVVLPADAGAAKPDPRSFRCALERLGVAPHEAVFVGDDPVEDVEGARRAGLFAIRARGPATLAELPDRLAALARSDGPRPPPAGPAGGEGSP